MKTSLIVYGRTYQKKCPFISICYSMKLYSKRNKDKRAIEVGIE